MTSPAQRRHARETYERWHEDVESPTADARTPWHDLLFAHLDPVRDLHGKAVLEIGCGRGELAYRIAAASAPRLFVGADFAQSAVRFARGRAARPPAGRVGWLVSDIQALALAAGFFDTVISCETIEHVPDPALAVRELHRVLRPGGRLLLTTPNYLGPFGAYRAYLRLVGRPYTEGGQPINHMTLLPRTIRWIRNVGFRVTAIDAAGHYILQPRRVPYAPSWLQKLNPVLWPFGLHSIVVAEKS
jgi:2-polyprenyl-3-methyl-5-hydroxy-6-metoxy-1,4-benzoquinol methylase